MLKRLFHLYQRKRIININVNIIAAGLLAIALSKIVILIAEDFIAPGRALAFTIIAVGSDIVFDVMIYYLLHWVANHWRPFATRSAQDHPHVEPRRPRPFFRDASLIQFERMLLSPLYYIIAATLMYTLQTWAGARPGWALVIAFPSGLLATRIIHTWYGIKVGRFRPHEPIPTPAPTTTAPTTTPAAKPAAKATVRSVP